MLPTPPRFFAIISGTLSLAVLLAAHLPLHAQQPVPSQVPTIQVTSLLVFLDVTVLDRDNQPVTKGLSRDDFSITEGSKPQRIFSFESPQEHRDSGKNPGGSAPSTIFVLDLLNSQLSDFSYILYSMKKYLDAQPSTLDSPSELMVLGNNSLELVQAYTRSKADLVSALRHIPGAIPYKHDNPSFLSERFVQSLDALQQVALQSKGVPGRKNIVWVGHGGPSINTIALDSQTTQRLDAYVHDTTNLLVDSRISLFVIYPGLEVGGIVGQPISGVSADADIGETDPFAGDINFGVFVNETGGKLFYNRNDVNVLIKRSQQLGANYYTLTYQPHDVLPDGKFRRIRVSLRDPALHALTKAGYFAPSTDQPIDTLQQTMVDISEAAHSTIPYNSLQLTISDIVRHPDTDTAQFIATLTGEAIRWQPAEGQQSTAGFILATASRDKQQDVLSSRIEGLSITAHTQDPIHLVKSVSRIPLTVRIPHKTDTVRVIVQAREGGLIGTADIDRKALDAAPTAPTPEPTLQTRPAPTPANTTQ
jgi:VWFA-related protein